MTELKKLFTMPHGTKQLKRDVYIKEKASDMEYRVRTSYLYLIRFTEREMKEKVREIRKIMTEFFSELIKDTNFQFQEPKESQTT